MGSCTRVCGRRLESSKRRDCTAWIGPAANWATRDGREGQKRCECACGDVLLLQIISEPEGEHKQRTNRADPSKRLAQSFRSRPETTPDSTPHFVCRPLPRPYPPPPPRRDRLSDPFPAPPASIKLGPNPASVSLASALVDLLPPLASAPASLPWPRLVLKKSLPLPPRLLTMLHPKIRPKTAKSRESQSFFPRHFTVRFSPFLPPRCGPAPLPLVLSSSSARPSRLPLSTLPPFPSSSCVSSRRPRFPCPCVPLALQTRELTLTLCKPGGNHRVRVLSLVLEA